jgi:hypothetical protein
MLPAFFPEGRLWLWRLINRCGSIGQKLAREFGVFGGTGAALL